MWYTFLLKDEIIDNSKHKTDGGMDFSSRAAAMRLISSFKSISRQLVT